MTKTDDLAHSLRWARKRWKDMPPLALASLKELVALHRFSIVLGDLLFFNNGWYVTHVGLLRLANRKSCTGIRVEALPDFCDSLSSHWTFKATVFKSRGCQGFVGYGDANPSNVSALVRGAELRIAETRAVNRALRKAYGIGICSVEEIGSVAPQATPQETERKTPKVPRYSANGNRNSGHGSNGNANGIRVRDRLCQVIRQHSLDAELVKAYAIDFCGTKTLREASRAQVESFVAHLADWAAKDRNALLCQLNSYSRPQAGAA